MLQVGTLIIISAATTFGACINPKFLPGLQASVGFQLEDGTVGQKSYCAEWNGGVPAGRSGESNIYTAKSSSCLANSNFTDSAFYQVPLGMVTVVDKIIVSVPAQSSKFVSKFTVSDSENGVIIERSYTANSKVYDQIVGPIILPASSLIRLDMRTIPDKYRDGDPYFLIGRSYEDDTIKSINSDMGGKTYEGRMAVYAREYDREDYFSGDVCY